MPRGRRAPSASTRTNDDRRLPASAVVFRCFVAPPAATRHPFGAPCPRSVLPQFSVWCGGDACSSAASGAGGRPSPDGDALTLVEPERVRLGDTERIVERVDVADDLVAPE